MTTSLRCGRFVLTLDEPRIMGIVNVTDDSFSGDGLAAQAQQAVEQGRRMVAEGAHLLDIGGESSRPGADPVSADVELQRVIPVIEGLRDCGVPLSVDTMKPHVMRAAIAAGADMINDINALQAPGAVDALQGSTVAVCLMHMRGEPRTMQQAPAYADVVSDVKHHLAQRVAVAEAAGIGRERIVLDPGFGFGKTLEHNLELLRRLGEFSDLGLPLLAGMSRKSMLGHLTDRPVDQRLAAGLVAHVIAVQRGARILRVHDVAAMRDAICIWRAVEYGA